MSELARRFRMPMDFYPVNELNKKNWFERFVEKRLSQYQFSPRRLEKKANAFVSQCLAYGKNLEVKSDFELQEVLGELRFQAAKTGMTPCYLKKIFAVVREFSARKLGMRHYDAQLKGGWAMINGMVAEMETGQGKTLTATLPAVAASLAGIPTHVITVNEYLATRDAADLKPLYHVLGVSVGVVTESMQEDEKRDAYSCDITYVTNKQIAFDHLRDRMIMREKSGKLSMQLESLYCETPRQNKLLLRGLCFAIVDEADSVLVDEAVTPLVISASHKNEQKLRFYGMALQLAKKLIVNEDFTINERERRGELTDAGREKLNTLGKELGGLWQGPLFRNELVENALRALYLFHKDKHYLINDENKVQLIDEFTGRVMTDRSWEGGLQQMVEVKEACEMTNDRETIARISYQRFFSRYKNLAGMSGTVKEVSGELWDVYRLKVMRISPAQILKRKNLPETVFLTSDQKWQHVVRRILELHQTGRPVLVGTRSVQASEYLSNLLKDKGINHQLLNARQDKCEAEIIAQAGEKDRITVATNMAGRGTDIKLNDEVRALGGLHVIATERHESRRIDRQLLGRCGRQGDPGSTETITCVSDEIVMHYCPHVILTFVKLFKKKTGVIHRWPSIWVVNYAQGAAEKSQYRSRVGLKNMDEHFANLLSFSGRVE